MPLVFAEPGKANVIKKVGGSPELKKHLETLGFVVGGTVTVIHSLGENLIVNVMESRIALSKETACKITV